MHRRFSGCLLYTSKHESCPAKELFAALREKHIYVRYFPKDRIDTHLRITIGTDEEMKKVVEVLTEYLQK